MIDALFGALFIVALLTRHAYAMLFVGMTLCHDAFFGEADGLTYYVTAGIADYVTILLINSATFIQLVALSSLILNFIGFLLWFSYLEPTIYNECFILLYIVTIVLTIKNKDNRDGVGYYNINISNNDFYKFDRPFSAFNSHREVGA